MLVLFHLCCPWVSKLNLVTLLNHFVQVSDGGVREAILTALKGVLQHAGKSVSVAVRTRAYISLKDLIHYDDDQVRKSAASILGILSQVCCCWFKEFLLHS